MKNEIAKVLDELTEFAKQLLPAMAAKDPECFPDHVDGSETGWRERLRRLADWRGAAGRLHHILATTSTSESSNLEAAEFRRFIYSDASPDYVFRDGVIHWQISVFVPMDWAEAAKLSLPPDCISKWRRGQDLPATIGDRQRHRTTLLSMVIPLNRPAICAII
jgi:hypothetical protein